jgi:hypothetical protein
MMSFDVVACSREVVSARPRAADGLEAAIHADAHGSIVGAGLLCEQRPDARREPLGSTRRSMWPLASHTPTRAVGTSSVNQSS